MRRSFPIALVLALLATMVAVGVARAHHVDELGLQPSCETKDVTLAVAHDIHSGHKLEWEVRVDGSKVAGDIRLPDSRTTTTIIVTDVVPYGTGVITARARATYPNGEPESKWQHAEAEYDCPKPPPPPPPPPPVTPPPKTVTPPVVKANAFAMLCGDPRLWVRVTNKGEVPVRARLTFVQGDKSKPTRLRAVVKTVGVGKTKIIGPRWVRGPVKLRLDGQLAFGFRVPKDLKPRRWGKGGCPDGRSGTPTFAKAMAKGSR